MNKSKITIVIADDHPLMLGSLNDELLKAGYDVVGNAKNGALALDLVVEHKPTIAILDIQMPLLSGFEVINLGIPKSPDTHFIIMTYHNKEGYLVQAKKFGAKGYLLKDDDIDEIEKCISAVMKGELYYSSSLKKEIKSVIDDQLRIIKQLTPTERTIIRLIAQGKSSAEIADQLSTAVRTIQKHRSNIISKLNFSNESADPLRQWTIEYKDLLVLL